MPGAEPGLPVRRTQTGDYEGYDEWLDQLEAMPWDEALDLARDREMERRLAHYLDEEGEHDRRELDDPCLRRATDGQTGSYRQR